jgi:MG2 domain/Carboxypeptidase regulatory-like domain/Macroglobulin domain MG3
MGYPMKRLLICIFCLGSSGFSQVQAARERISVDESLTKIHIAGDAISPTLVIENAGAVTSARVQVQLVDPSDMVRTPAETEVQLRTGANRVRLELRGWKQKSNEWNDSIWYRLRYKVMVPAAQSPIAEGILALSTKADGVFDMRVVTSQNALPGKPLRVRIYTQSVSDLRPMPSVKVRAELEPDDAENKLTRAGVTDARGFAQLEFNVPSTWTGSATVKVVASKGQVVREADEEVSFHALWRFFVSTDKPLYQPGQTVHIRALLLDPNKHALAKTPVAFTIADENDTVVYRATSNTSRFGVAREEWDIPENLRLGNYAIKVTPGTESDEDDYYRQGYQNIRVSRYELPTFAVNVKADRAYYLRGQNAAVTVNADYLFGKPVTKGHVKVARESEHRWNFKEQRWDVEEEQKWEGDLGTDGKFIANVDLSEDQENLEESGRYRDLEFSAYLTESSTGKTEQRRFNLRITRDPIHIYVIEAGNLAPGQLPLEFYISTSYADGSPAQCELAIHQGSVRDDKPGAVLRTTKTNRYGVARIGGLNLPPLTPSGKNVPLGRLVVLARDRQGRTGHETQDLWDTSDGLVIEAQTNHALYRPSEPIEVDLHANRSDGNLLLDVLREGRVVRSQSVRLHGGHAFVVVPYLPEFQGELTIAAYSPAEASNSYDIPIATRTVLYPHDPELKVTAKFDRATYRPGEDAVLNLRVRKTDGNPVEAALGAVIFDQAVEERARTDVEFGRGPGYGFDGQFGSYWYENNQIGGLRRTDLDRLNTSEPFVDDLQLAAEVLLLNRWGDRPSVFGGANYPAGAYQAFRERFESELAPVKIALNDAYSKDFMYPHSPDSLKQVLKAQGVNFDSVLDPWGSPFRARFSFNRNQEIMELVSSGPDKKPGTEDDPTAMSVQRSYFQKTGAAIDKAIDDYHSRTGAFIRDTATLKSELGKYGIDWDSLRDPSGRCYEARFGIADTRYTLVVMSAGPNGRFENGPGSDDFPVWTNYSEYFVDTAVKIDSALSKHFAAAHSFPQNEAEFDEVLNEARISRSELHDAWGHRLQPVFDNQAKYQDRIVIDYSELVTGTQLRSQKVAPETREYAFIHLYSSGLDGIPHTCDDFELAKFSREIARQSSTMAQPSANATAVPLSGGSGGITGVITDPSGAVVAHTKVVAELNGKVQFSAETDENGRYTFRNLPTGVYTVTATATGFRSSVITRVPVKSLNTTEVNLTLNLGAAMETVEVSAGAPQ